MCTLIVLYHVDPERPLVIAANRDEFRSRRSTTPRLVSTRPRVLAGIDEKSGGTWLGATQDGFFAGLTNQRTGNFSQSTRASRGQLVSECLGLADPSRVRSHLEGIQPADYNPFNLMFGNASQLWVAYSRREASKVHFESVPHGVSVLPNGELGSARFAKVARAKALLAKPGASLAASRLRYVLADHVRPPLSRVPRPPRRSLMPRFWARQLDSLCVHAGVYGTCSSTLIEAREGATLRYLFAAGPPCKTPLQDVTARFSETP